MDELVTAQGDESSNRPVANAALTEAVGHEDLIHISLAGMGAIVLLLLLALSFPLWRLPPIADPLIFGAMALAALVAMGGLYVLNIRVHQHMANQARLTEVLVNSLGQGFLVFDCEGLCEQVYSQACVNLLETVPAGRQIEDVLGVPEEGRADFRDWLLILFQPDHALGFEDVVRFLPQFFPHSRKKRISLVYRPIYTKSGALFKVVVIATDQTEEFAARALAQQKQDFAEMVCRIFRDRNQFYVSLAHVHAFLDEAAKPEMTRADAPRLLRQLHTLKASVKQFNMLDLASVVHKAETEIGAASNGDEDSFRSTLLAGRYKIADALKAEIGRIGDVVGLNTDRKGTIHEVEEDKLYAFAQRMQNEACPPGLIHDYLMDIVSVPLRACFVSFERELMDLAGLLDKQIKPVVFSGDNPRVLLLPLQEFFFSLIHICRNIMDHGIEAPVTRMARGKEAAGTVTVQTRLVPRAEGGTWLRIVISDDGNGVDVTRIRAKLAEVEPDGTWRHEDDQTVIQRILSWGLSTKEEVSEISGRGVGLDAVDREVRALGGSIHVRSNLYKGTRFEIQIPYVIELPEIQREALD